MWCVPGSREHAGRFTDPGAVHLVDRDHSGTDHGSGDTNQVDDPYRSPLPLRTGVLAGNRAIIGACR